MHFLYTVMYTNQLNKITLRYSVYSQRYSVYSLVSTEMFTQPSFPNRPVHRETISIPQRDIPEQDYLMLGMFMCSSDPPYSRVKLTISKVKMPPSSFLQKRKNKYRVVEL